MAKKNYNLKLKGYVGEGIFQETYVDFMLDKNKDNSVNVLIDSTGGSLRTALSIAASFRNHGDVSVHFVGLNASAATIASLGAKHISIDSAAMYLVHKCSSGLFEFGSFNADQLQDLIERIEQTKSDLNKFDANVAEMYARKCKKCAKDLLELMKKGGWLNAKEALEWGFVDEITDDEEDAKPVLTSDVAAHFCEEGIPMPDVPVYDKDAENLFSRMFAYFASLLKGNSRFTNNIQEPKEPEKEMKTFKKICALLALEVIAFTDGKCALTEEQVLALENGLADKDALNDSLTEKSDALALAQQDLNTKSAMLAYKDAELTAKTAEITNKDALIASKDAEISALKAQIDAMKKAPGDETNHVVDNKSGDSSPVTAEEQFVDTYNKAQEMFDSIS